MKWKTGLGAGKKKSSSLKTKGERGSSSTGRSESASDFAATSTASADKLASTHNLGTIRVGILRPESAPICTPTPGTKRQLISELLEPDEEEENEGKTVSASPALRSIISNKSSTGKSFDKEAGKGDSFSSYTPEEKVAFACHLNAHLLGDPFLKHLLPLDAGGADFFDKFHDGVLLCRILCLAVPGSIADSKINVPAGSEPLSLYKSTENLNAALTAAERAGLQVVNIGASDIMAGRPASILGLSWQLIRVHLLAQINLKRCPDLVHLMEDGEETDDFFALPVEEVLLRWFNHHLRWAKSERRVKNFSDNLADGICYMLLIKELNDKFQMCDWPGEDEKRAQFRRACHVISGAEGIGIAPLIRPRHINGKAQLYNIAFVAQLFNRRPRIHRERLHLGAALCMQSWFRMLRVKRETQPILEQRRAAANTIAYIWRQHFVWKKERELSATKIQAAWRGVRGRREALERKVTRERLAATKLQAFFRGVQARKEVQSRRTELASVKLQAYWRGVQGRRKASSIRERKRRVEEVLAAAKKAEEIRQARVAKLNAARAARIAHAKAYAAKVRAETAMAKALAERRKVESAAAIRLQAWFRGMRIRKAVAAARAAKKMARQQPDPYDSSGHSMLKESQGNTNSASPRTSVSSSVRWSEEPLGPEGSPWSQPPAPGIDSGPAPAFDPASPTNWLNKMFAGMSFPSSDRPALPPKREEILAATAIQRWRRRVLDGRAERVKAMAIAERRRRAVRTLHKAYALKWRFEIDRLTKIRHQKQIDEDQILEETLEERQWFTALCSEIARALAGAFANKKSIGTEGALEEEDSCLADGPIDYRDSMGRAVLAAEVGLKPEYVAQLVMGCAGTGEAQEARALELARSGKDVRPWTPPEDALSPMRFVIMMVALMGAVLETTVVNAAASGI